MRRYVPMIGILVAAGFAAAGCNSWNPFYRSPNVEPKFSQVITGMDKSEVVKLLGKPTGMVEHEMWYLYDDPDDPVRLRFVLNDSGDVVEKFYETRSMLVERLKQKEQEVKAPEPLPGEEKRTYPGGPLERFQQMTKP